MSDWRNRMEAQARPLAVDLAKLNLVHQLLLDKLHDPICGKSGHGFKAMARVKKDIAMVENLLAGMNARIEQFVSDHGAASPASRKQRQQLFDAVYEKVIQVRDDTA